MGHSTPTTTLQIYAHSFRETQARALDALADTINFSKAVGQ